MRDSTKLTQKHITFLIISAFLFLGMFTPTLVLAIIGNHLSSIIIIDSAIILTWILILPFFIFKYRKLFYSWIFGVIFIPIFLFIVEINTLPGQWFYGIALPGFSIAIIGIGLIGFIWTGIKLKPLYALFLTFIFLGIITYLENLVTINILGNTSDTEIRKIIALILTMSSIPFLILALCIHKSKAINK